MRLKEKAKSFLYKNSGHILATGAVGGIALTAFLVAKETETYKKMSEKAANKKEKIKALFASYWPAMLTAGATVGCVVGLDLTSMRKIQAGAEALAAMKKTTVMISDEAEAYKKKLEETDPSLVKEIKKEIATERSHNMPDPVELYKIAGYDIYFEATPTQIWQAKYDYNRLVQTNGYASVTDLYRLIDAGIPTPQKGLMYGHRKSDYHELDWVGFRDEVVKYKKDGTKYLEISFIDPPYTGYSDPDWKDIPDMYFREQPEVSDEVPFEE